MFPFPEKLRKEHEQWRKDNPEQAAAMDSEINDIMNRVAQKSLEKYGVQKNGCYRIDDKLFLDAIREQT